MFKVNFHYVDEFLKELDKDRSAIERGIVRVTLAYEQPKPAYPIIAVKVVASAVVEGFLIELRQDCGSYLGEHDSASKQGCLDKGQAIVDKVEAFAQQQQLQTRAGMHVMPAQQIAVKDSAHAH